MSLWFQPMPSDELLGYLQMARALLSQGAVEVDKPSEPFVRWASRALRARDSRLVDAVARLAEATALARGERYIELQLVAPGSTANDPITDLEASDRFRLLRLVAADHRRFDGHGLATSVEGEAAVLFSGYDDAVAGASKLTSEEAFSEMEPAILLYACTFNPVLPEEYLEAGDDPLNPARDFLQQLSEGQRARILDLTTHASQPVALRS